MKDLVAGIVQKQDQFIKDDDDQRKKCDKYQNVMKANSDIKQPVDELEKNEVVKFTCNVYEATLQIVRTS